MNFDWQPEESEIRQRTVELFDAAAMIEIETIEEAGLATIEEMLRRYLGHLAKSGYLSIGIGLEGRGKALTFLPAQEELSRISGSLFLAVETSIRLFGGLLADWGQSSRIKDILKALEAGEVIGAVAISEPGGSEPIQAGLTTARAKGDVYFVTGRKSFVTNGPIANWLAVSGQVDGLEAFFLVQPGQEGLVISPRLKTLGLNGLAVSTLELTEVAVPADLVIFPQRDESARTNLSMIQDFILAIASLGVIKRTMDAANAHSHAHHRGDKPIYAHQEVRFKLADMFTLYQTAQLLIYRAGWFYAQAEREAGVLISCAKVFASDAAERVSALAMQILAGQGYIAGNPVERGYRDAKYAGLAGTTSEVSRMLVADDLLRRYPA